MDPRKDCDVILEEHAEDRIVDRGLGYRSLERMVREGSWQRKRDRKCVITYRKWTIMVKLGQCTIAVDTAFPRGRRK